MKKLRIFILAAATLICSTSQAQLSTGLSIDEGKEASLCPYIDVDLGYGPWNGDITYADGGKGTLFDGKKYSLATQMGWNISKKHKKPIFVEFNFKYDFDFDKLSMYGHDYSIFGFDMSLGGNLAYIIPVVKGKFEVEPYAGFGFNLISVDGSTKGQTLLFFKKEDKSWADCYDHAYYEGDKANRFGIYGNAGLKLIIMNNIMLGYGYTKNLTNFFNTDKGAYPHKVKLSSPQFFIGYRFKIK